MSKPQKTLVDGREVDNDSMEWRQECLARDLLKKPIEERREYIADLEEKRGKRVADELRDLLRKVFDAKRDAA